MITTSGIPDASYGQIELYPGDGGAVLGLGDTADLVWSVDGVTAVLAIAREYGEVLVEVRLTDRAPELDPAWDAVVDFSVRAGEGIAVTGWAGSGETVPVPVAAGVHLRVRYAVLAGQSGADQFAAGDDGPARERYLVHVWPAEPGPARVLATTSPWSQYWGFGAPAAELVAALADVPDPPALRGAAARAGTVRGVPESSRRPLRRRTRGRSGGSPMPGRSGGCHCGDRPARPRAAPRPGGYRRPGRAAEERTTVGIQDSLYAEGYYRPHQGRIIGGVCAGLGRKWGLTPWSTRLLFILTLFVLPGSQILIYPLLWIVLPDERTAWR